MKRFFATISAVLVLLLNAGCPSIISNAYDAGLKAGREARSAKLERLRERHEEAGIAGRLAEEGAALSTQGKYDEAEAKLREASQKLEAARAPGPKWLKRVQAGSIHFARGINYLRWGKPSAAKSELEEAVPLLEKARRSSPPETQDMLAQKINQARNALASVSAELGTTRR